jgi:glycosyltransferase involved in cell wall biosynthesis
VTNAATSTAPEARTDYLIAVQAPAYPLSPTSFATESAFAEHLIELRKVAGARFSTVVLFAPRMNEADYEAQKHHLGIVDLARDNVRLVPAHPVSASVGRFWLKHARPLWSTMRAAIREAAVVHTDLSTDVRRPMTAMVSFAAWLAKRPVVFVVDIDYRMHARRFRELGYWSAKKYWVNRLVQEPLKSLQLRFAARRYQLVMLKGASLVRDFGEGRSHVKNFYDTVHSDGQLLPTDQIDERLAMLANPGKRLQLCYFGRLVEYKGIDRMIEAVRLAREKGCIAELTIIGDGPCRAALGDQVREAALENQIRFEPQVPYGQPLFDQLRQVHMMIAAPLIEDTPRAAFDAMARGVPILAFDISYFSDLADASGAVALATWPHASGLAEQIIAIDSNRSLLGGMALGGLAFARANTQHSWLERRMQWTFHYAMGEHAVPLSRPGCAE